MKEIVIGGNLKPNLNSMCLWSYANIFENSKFYILENNSFGYRLFIVKESEEGVAIQQWISKEENRNNDSVENKSLEFLLPFLNKDDIIQELKNRYECGFKKGYEQSQREIRKAIGLPI